MKKFRDLFVQLIFVVAVLVFWQVRATQLNIATFPTLDKVFSSLLDSFTSNTYNLLEMVGNSLRTIVIGLALGVLLAFVFSSLSVAFKPVNAVYNLIVSVFDLLPGVALLPIIMIISGPTQTSIIILVVHSVIWPMSRSIIDGFKSIPKLYIESGKNIGLNRFSLVTGVYIPASFASILSGIKVGWARAWRGLISAEMIFGATSTTGAGIGFYIQLKRSYSDYGSLFASLFVIIIIGIIVEYGIFHSIEKATIRKWGMVR